MQKKSNLRLLCLAAMFAAVIYVFTAFIHIPSHTGYTHIGDAFLYLVATLLPTPYAAAAGAIGAILSDVLTGYAMWAPGSFLIKTLTAMVFSSQTKKIVCIRNLIALLPAFLLCAGGYYLYEAMITQNFIAPLAGIPGYCVQVGLSSIVFLVVGSVFDRLHLKERLQVKEEEIL